MGNFSFAPELSNNLTEIKDMEITVKNNEQFGSLEIYFDSKPSEAVREALKALKFRWHGIKKCWYGKAEKPAVLEAVANAQAGKKPETPAPAEVKAERIDGNFYTDEFLKAHPEKAPKIGDVVEVIDSPAKTVNGFYYITQWGKKTWCGGYGSGLKKSNLEQCSKASLYWPPRNGSGTAAAHEANKKFIPKLRVLGPVSGAAFREIMELCDRSREDLKRVKNEFFRETGATWRELENLAPRMACYKKLGEADFTTRDFTQDPQFDPRDSYAAENLEEYAAAAARMTEENPDLLERAEAPTFSGPGLKIHKNGLSVRQKDGTWDFSALTIRKNGENVTIDSHWGDSSHGNIPGGFALDITNDSDSMTDYFDTDSATVTPAHPLYSRFVAAAEGAKPYELTDEDAENLGKYRQAKKEAKEAEEEAGRAACREKQEEFQKFAAEIVTTWEGSFPWAPGCGPSVVVEWSEVGALHEGSEEDTQEGGGMAKRYSVDAFDRITADLDKWMKEHDRGYLKVKFTVEFPDEMPSYTDRVDVGDGVGGMIGALRSLIKYHEDRGETDGATVTGIFGHTLDYSREVLRRLEEATDSDAREIDEFLDSLAG